MKNTHFIITTAFLLSASQAIAAISWSTPSGFVRADDATPLLNSGSALFQLIHSSNGVANLPTVGGGASGDDTVLQESTVSSVSASDYGQHFSSVFTNILSNGYVYVRAFDAGTSPGNVTNGTAYFTGPIVAVSNITLPYPNQEVAEGSFAAGPSSDGLGHYVLNTNEFGSSPLGEALDAPPDLVWSTGGGGFFGAWYPQTVTTHDGVDAAESTVELEVTSWIETTITGPIAVAFWWEITSYGSFNYPSLSFSVDGVQKGALYDSSAWQSATYVIPAGTHTSRWALYGGSSMFGDGAIGHLDQVSLQPVAPEIEVLGTNLTVVTNGAATTSATNGTDFGASLLTGGTVTRTFYLRNSGSADLLVSGVTTGDAQAADFQILGFPSVVAMGTSSNLTIRFDPSDSGGRTAVVIVANNDADEGSYSFAVSGRGLADGPYLQVLGGAGTWRAITNGSTAITNTLGTDFGSQYVTGFSTSRTFGVTNAGNAVLNISAVNLGGAHPGDFVALAYPATVVPGTRSNLVVQFDPSATGSRSSVVEIVSDDMGAPSYTFAVGGTGLSDTPEILVLGTNGQSILDGDMTVSAVDGTHFGGVAAFSGSVDRVFAVTNSGAVELLISNVTFQGSGAAHFSAVSPPATVGSRMRSDLRIRFSPTAVGAATAVVVIANNDGDENPYEFAVRGDGTATHYVWTNSPSPEAPYLSWETAAHTIQSAATVCVNGDVILVTNGTYNTGGVYGGGNTNRVCITNAVRVSSVNGPEHTFIAGSTNGGVGSRSIRCVYLSAQAFLGGFTLTNGAASSGGGVYAQDSSAVISNCVMSGNRATTGGGVYQCTVYDSVISGNYAGSGGGGACYSTLHRCQVVGNQAGSYEIVDGQCCCLMGYDPLPYCACYWPAVGGGGGGAYQCTLHSCLLAENAAPAGGGASFSRLINCTLVSNQAAGVVYSNLCGAVFGGGGGMFRGSATNCIFDGNTDLTVPTRADWDGYYGCSETNLPSIAYSCLTNPPATGTGNVNGSATFVPGTYRLLAGSLGIDVGDNASVQGVLDLDGQPRIVNAIVDMGAYEFSPPPPDSDGDGILDAHETDTGVYVSPTDTGTDPNNPDSDGDKMSDGDEVDAGTDPNNEGEYFAFQNTRYVGSGWVVSWWSKEGKTYNLFRLTNLLGSASASNIASNVSATDPMNVYTDTTAVGLGPWFYKVDVMP